MKRNDVKNIEYFLIKKFNEEKSQRLIYDYSIKKTANNLLITKDSGIEYDVNFCVNVLPRSTPKKINIVISNGKFY